MVDEKNVFWKIKILNIKVGNKNEVFERNNQKLIDEVDNG